MVIKNKDYTFIGIFNFCVKFLVGGLAATLLAVVGFFGADIYKSVQDLNYNMHELNGSIKQLVKLTDKMETRINNHEVVINKNTNNITELKVRVEHLER